MNNRTVVTSMSLKYLSTEAWVIMLVIGTSLCPSLCLAADMSKKGSCGRHAVRSALGWLDHNASSERVKAAMRRLPESGPVKLSTLSECFNDLGLSTLRVSQVPNFSQLPGLGDNLILVVHTIRQDQEGAQDHYEVISDYDAETGRVTVMDLGLPALRYPWDQLAPRCSGHGLLVGRESAIDVAEDALGIGTVSGQRIHAMGAILLRLERH